ncbi:MAG: tannase/feruloyl esterase family alpha/beta hydrolase [Gammaproteobacteria bacterium]|nr:tannase/feruloyl esterase family alpha/beta hydrolase [Gammaproteobacteria bacterium]
MLRLRLPLAKITTADEVAPGAFREPAGDPQHGDFSDLPGFCRVHGFVHPVPDSNIGFEVWLPLGTWSGRLHMVGNGAYMSSIYWPELANRIRQGDVGVATDTGHEGGSLKFGVGHPQRIIDWGQRAVHATVAIAKLVTRAYFGIPARYSYFSGCSTGGEQALSEAQRYPADFNGIIAGDPGNYRTTLNMAFLWQFEKNHRPGDDAHPILGVADLELLHDAVLKACDAVDGVRDGVINDPRDCKFDVASLLCKQGAKGHCLSAEQVSAIRAMYAGPSDPVTGAQIYPGYTLGSEGIVVEPGQKLPGWTEYWANPLEPEEPQRVDFFRDWVFADPAWNWWRFDWHTDPGIVAADIGPKVDAVNPDLRAFADQGGKLIMFMGWADPVGSALAAPEYYRQVEEFTANHLGVKDAMPAVQKYLRLYMIPGMGHCAGGPGPTNFSTATRDSTPPVGDASHDMIMALEDWVEKDEAPGSLIGTHYADKKRKVIAFQRPLCVYPAVARYAGGDVKEANSFRCESRH